MTALGHDADAFAGRTLLAVFAHPDDESITCGGLLAACSDRGAAVSVLCLTRGEAGPSAGAGAPHLAATRTSEIERAAALLGVGEVILADHQDGMLPWTDTATIDRDIRAAIERLGPEVVITFGADGLYWHPDHIAVHERVTAVVTAMAGQAPALYYATMPPGAIRAVFDRASARARAAGGDAPRQVLGIADPDAWGSHAAPPTLVVDVRAQAGRKLAALRSHATQLDHDALTWLTAEDAVLLGTEHFHTVGTPTGFIERLGA